MWYSYATMSFTIIQPNIGIKSCTLLHHSSADSIFKRFLRLDTVGTHRSGCARFSSDGRWVFGWSQDAGINHFYKWDTHYHQRWSQTDNSVTLKRRWHIRDQPKSVCFVLCKYPCTLPTDTRRARGQAPASLPYIHFPITSSHLTDQTVS